MGSMYRVHLERLAKEKNIKNYSFDNYVRFRAEEQVRWQGSPNQALQMLMESAYHVSKFFPIPYAILY